MKASDLREKNDSELREELLALRREQFNLRMQAATGQLGRSSEFQVVRRDIARIKTVMTERKLAGSTARGEAGAGESIEESGNA